MIGSVFKERFDSSMEDGPENRKPESRQAALLRTER